MFWKYCFINGDLKMQLFGVIYNNEKLPPLFLGYLCAFFLSKAELSLVFCFSINKDTVYILATLWKSLILTGEGSRGTHLRMKILGCIKSLFVRTFFGMMHS